METYTEIKKRHQDVINSFPMVFAFSEKQLNEGIEKLGVQREDCISVGCGCIIRKTDKQNLKDLMAKYESEMKEFLAIDECLIDAIVYELGNHEYCITYDPTDTIECLGLDMTDERVSRLFKVAKKQYIENCTDF